MKLKSFKKVINYELCGKQKMIILKQMNAYFQKCLFSECFFKIFSDPLLIDYVGSIITKNNGGKQ